MNTHRFFADRGISLGLMVLAAVVVLIAPAAWADPPSRAARLNYITGAVSLAPAGLPDEWGEAFVNRPLTVGDRLWADTGGRAELRLGSTALRIDGGTSLDILDISDRMLQVSIDQGRAQVRTRGGNGGNAEIDTPAAAVVLNGAADVRVDVDASTGRTFIAVRFGRANIYTPSESFDLGSGETTRIDADGRYYTVGRAAARDAFDNFAYTRDQRWREPRYVSSEMTGYEDLDSYGAWQPAAEYGNVWFPRQVANDWVPYRDGRWVWVEPWGWTWVDNAPWGFAPFHYGRWVQVNNRWGWWPGERVQTPVYAPALVAFFGGDNLGISVSVGVGPAVGWFPLGYRDPYIPWYTASPAYRRSVNVAYVRDPVVLNQVVNITNVNVTNVTNIRYAHRDRNDVATVVPRQTFVSAQSVRPVAVAVSAQRVASATMVAGAPAAPERASLVGRQGRAERAPRADRVNKPVVAVNAPASAPPPRFEQRVQDAQQAQGKPFEVKPLRDDRRDAPNRTAQAAPQPGAAPVPNAAASTGRELRVIKPAPAESRQARDRGARQDQAQPGRGPQDAQPTQPAPQAVAPAATPPTARTAPGNDREAPQREAQQREAQQREATQRDSQQREAQQREGQQREAQQRQAQQREDAQQRETQQRQAQQQREAQQREAAQKDSQQREAQQRQAQQREAQQQEAQQREAQQRQTQQREAQDRAAQQREAQQREAQQRQTQQREAQERAAQQRDAQQREAQQRQAQQREAQQREAQQREQQRAQQQAQAPGRQDAPPPKQQAQPQPQPQAQQQHAPGKGHDQARSADNRTDEERKRDEDRKKGGGQG